MILHPSTLPPLLSSPTPSPPPTLLFVGLAIIRREDDAFKTIEERHARPAVSEVYDLQQESLHLGVDGGRQFAPPLRYSETKQKHRNSRCYVRLSNVFGNSIRQRSELMVNSFAQGVQARSQPGL